MENGGKCQSEKMDASALWLKKKKKHGHVTSANFERRNRKCWNYFENLSLIGSWVYTLFLLQIILKLMIGCLPRTSVSFSWPLEVKPYIHRSYIAFTFAASFHSLRLDIIKKIPLYLILEGIIPIILLTKHL